MYRAPFFFSLFPLFLSSFFSLVSDALFGVRFYMIGWLYEMIYQIDFFSLDHLKSMHHLFFGRAK